MGTFFWFIDLILPISIILIGLLMKSHPPKTINSIIGYRTRRSMRSQEAWDYANSECGRLWSIIGIFLTVIIVLNKLLIPLPPENLSIINNMISLIGLCLPILMIENKLLKKFK